MKTLRLRRLLPTSLVPLLALLAALGHGCRSAAPPRAQPAAVASKPAATLDLAQRREVFLAAWKTIQEKHFDPSLHGVDWTAVRDRIAPKVDAARDDREFLAALQEMVKALGQSHIGIGPPSERAEPSTGKASSGTIGLHAGWIDGKLIVTRVEKRSAAERARIAAGDEILGIDGDPVEKLTRDLPPLLGERWQGAVPYVFGEATAGSVGGTVHLDVASADGARRTVELARAAPEFPAFDFGYLGSIPVEYETRTLPGEVLYVRFTPCIVDAESWVERALGEHKDARGVVLDLRENPGGVGGVAMAIARLLVDRPVELGTMHVRENPELRFFVNPDESPYRGPVVILVDGSTGSTAEILAAGLQAVGRVRVVGSRSLGMALPSIVVELPCRWRLQTVIADFQLPNGKLVEGGGVTPDVAVPTSLADLRAGRDPALEAALAELPKALTAADVKLRAEERMHATAVVAGPVDVSPEAEAVMTKLAAALHAEKMSTHKSMHVRSHMSIMGSQGDIDQIREAPDKSYTITHIALAGEIVQVYDGEHGWSSNAIQGLRELKGPELATARRGACFDANVAWRDLYAKVEILEPRDVDGRRALLVQATPREGEGAPVLTYVDPETYLPFRAEFMLESEMGKVHSTVDFSDYKEFQGVLQPTKSVAKVNGLEVAITVDDVEWDVPVDEALFQKPAKVEKVKAK